MPSLQDLDRMLATMRSMMAGASDEYATEHADDLPKTNKELEQALLRDVGAIKNSETYAKAISTCIAAKIAGVNLDVKDAKTGKAAINLIVESIAQHILQADDIAINLAFVRQLLHVAEELMTAGVDTTCTVTHPETFSCLKGMKEKRMELSVLMSAQDPEEYAAKHGDKAAFNAFEALEHADATRLAAIYFLQRCFSLKASLNSAMEEFAKLASRLPGKKISLANVPFIIAADFDAPFRFNKAKQNIFENGAEQLLMRLMPILISSRRKTICLEFPSNSTPATLLQDYESCKSGKIPFAYTSRVAQKHSLLKYVAGQKHFEDSTSFIDPQSITTKDVSEATLHYSVCKHLDMHMDKIRGVTMGYQVLNAAIRADGKVIAVVDSDAICAEVYSVIGRHSVEPCVVMPLANKIQSSEQVAKAQASRALGFPINIIDMCSTELNRDLALLMFVLSSKAAKPKPTPAKPVTPQFASATAGSEDQGYVLVDLEEDKSGVDANQQKPASLPQQKPSA